jgi:predicted RND superfamily exporter protein
MTHFLERLGKHSSHFHVFEDKSMSNNFSSEKEGTHKLGDSTFSDMPLQNSGQHSTILTFGHTVLRWRWWLLIAVVIGVGLMASGLQFLSLTTDNRVFFGPNNPQLLALQAFENTYTESNNALIVFAPQENDVFNRSTLAAIEAFTAASWSLPYANRVESLTNFPHTFAEGDDLIVEDLVMEAQQLSDEELAHIRRIALNDPLIIKRFVSTQGHVAAVQINFLLPDRADAEAIKKISSHLRELAAQTEKEFPKLKLYLSGDIMLGATVGEATENDVATLIPLMFIIILFIIALSLRSLMGMMITLFVILLASLSAMGLAGWLGYVLNPGSAVAPTIILTIVVADSIHIITTMLDAMRQGAAKRDAILHSLSINFYPVFLTSFTTAIGFLTMNFSDSPPFNDLGNLVAIGVIAAFLFSVTILPVLLMILPIQSQPRRNDLFMDRLSSFVIAHRNLLLWGMILVALLLVAGIPRIELTDDWDQYFDKRYTFRTDTDFIIDNLTGIEILEYSLRAKGEHGINEPAYLATIEAFANWLREQPGVDHVYVLTDIIKRLNMNMHGDDPAYYKIPDDAQLVAQYLLVYEMSLPYGQDMNDRIDVARSQTRLTAMGDISTTQLRQLEADSFTWLTEHAPPYMVTNATGMSIVFAHISQRNIDTMLFGSMLALILISALLIIALRSWKIGLISLLPNLLPAAMAFGLWGWLIGEVGMAVSVVGAMTLGIIVDDTVHFLSKYQRARRAGMDAPTSVRYAFRTVGKALSITTVALVAGFGILALSGFQVNWAMGLLSAITIAFALTLDLLLLPPLLLKNVQFR